MRSNPQKQFQTGNGVETPCELDQVPNMFRSSNIDHVSINVTHTQIHIMYLLFVFMHTYLLVAVIAFVHMMGECFRFG